MKKTVLMMCLCLFLLLPLSSAFSMTLQEEYNAGDSPYGGTWYATQIALKYVPSVSYDLARVEFFTGNDKDDITIALRPDAGGSPDTTILASGQYDSSGTGQWLGATFGSAYPVVAGSTYWITWYNTADLLAPVMSSAETHLYRWGEGGGVDSYPNTYGGYGFKTRFYGGAPVPLPATIFLFGPGLAAVGVLRKKLRG